LFVCLSFLSFSPKGGRRQAPPTQWSSPLVVCSFVQSGSARTFFPIYLSEKTAIVRMQKNARARTHTHTHAPLEQEEKRNEKKGGPRFQNF
jgi:hypothetical protein